MADCKKFYENSVTGIRGDTRLLENKRACSGLGKNFYMGAWILFVQICIGGGALYAGSLWGLLLSLYTFPATLAG